MSTPPESRAAPAPQRSPNTHEIFSESLRVDPTDFGSYVDARMSRGSSRLDQSALRRCLGLSSSFLITDATMNPEGGAGTWFVGFSRLIDLAIALHAKNELELETFNAASKACSECWSATGTWRGFEECRDGVRTVAAKLKDLLDSNGRTYKGEGVYVP